MGFLLFIISLIISWIVVPFSFIYAIVKMLCKFELKKTLPTINKYFFAMAVSVDQFGNVVAQELFNDVLIKKRGHHFGNEDETVSSVLGKNKQASTLTSVGKFIAFILNKLDSQHTDEAIETDENKI